MALAARAVPRTLLFFLVALGLFAGNRVGEALAREAAWLGRYYELGAGPLRVDLLGFFRLDFGFALRLNAAGALAGLLVGWIAGRRLGR